MYTFYRFKALSSDMQIEELSRHGIMLDLAYTIQNREAVLFAYGDFYVEMVVQKYSDDIHAVRCFQSMKRLEPYLRQVDISEITDMLRCNL
ncbi:hypothetical protein [Flavisolibacter nicotianae]|uniref:hypothetical protein n=1 Tax=Flavisolibacter nicotianae TaxID=2364882 RepID=UPI000EB2D1C8|nr:hypothetical protein [Flavisolibacter nicotianae]